MKVVAIFSGGMDSTTMLYRLKADGHTVKAVGFDYGQRHLVELRQAEMIAAEIEVPYETIDLSGIAPAIAGQSSQLNNEVDVPDGHYTDESMKATVVPNRNMIMLSVAIGHAVAIEFDAVAYGAHAGDHTIYPDCRAEFVRAMEVAASLCDWRKIRLETPFLNFTKADIAKCGAELSVPFAKTWSCYKGKTLQCGTCGTCVERREAFELAGIKDPSTYDLPSEKTKPR